jgi:hypothetical protein
MIERIKYPRKTMLIFFYEGVFVILLCKKEKENYYKTLEHKTFFFPIRLLWKFHCSIERQKKHPCPQ